MSADDYPEGTRLRHHAGSLWEVVEFIGGPHEDRHLLCLQGTKRPGFIGGEEAGRDIVVHGEYLPRSFRVESLPDLCPTCGRELDRTSGKNERRVA